jgi:hypothetical protein
MKGRSDSAGETTPGRRQAGAPLSLFFHYGSQGVGDIDVLLEYQQSNTPVQILDNR